MKHEFTILHNAACNFWKFLKRDLEALVRDQNLDADIKEVLVKDDAEAARLKFSGSPQLLVNGRDIDPMADRITTFHVGGCRPVLFREKLHEYPPREMIAEALGIGA